MVENYCVLKEKFKSKLNFLLTYRCTITFFFYSLKYIENWLRRVTIVELLTLGYNVRIITVTMSVFCVVKVIVPREYNMKVSVSGKG